MPGRLAKSKASRSGAAFARVVFFTLVLLSLLKQPPRERGNARDHGGRRPRRLRPEAPRSAGGNERNRGQHGKPESQADLLFGSQSAVEPFEHYGEEHADRQCLPERQRVETRAVRGERLLRQSRRIENLELRAATCCRSRFAAISDSCFLASKAR